MKSKNLKLIVAVEAVLLVCLCLGVAVGVFYYLGGQALTAGDSPPPAQPVAEATATLFPAVVETPTDTPTPGPSGTLWEQLPDGMLKYVDYDAGFELVVPNGWLGLRPSDPLEFDAALKGEGARNEILRDQVLADQANIEASDRLYLYVLRPDILKNAVFGFSQTVWDSDDTQVLDNTTLGTLVRSLELDGDFPGFKVVASNIDKNQNKVSIMSIRGRFTINYDDGSSVPVVGTVIFFKPTSNSIVRIVFTVMKEFDPQIAPDIEAIVASIKLLGQ